MSFISKATVLLTSLFICLLLSACDSKTTANNTASSAIKLSDELQGIYNRSCKNCHTLASTSAPLTGDIETWNKILHQGITQVVENAMQGAGGMPPAGQCFECTPEQIEALILYMANPAD